MNERTLVLYSRRTFPKLSRAWLRSDFHGLFSEFHSVLGALAYATSHGAAAVRINFTSPLYADRARGPNWWTYFFDRDTMTIGGGDNASPREVHLNGIVTKYGRYGGFSDVVGGPLAHLYPMTYGLSRSTLHRLVQTHLRVRSEIVAEAERFLAARVRPEAYLVGVHYRWTDATHAWTGTLSNYRTTPVPYAEYAEEIRRVIERAGRMCQVFVATDEVDFLEFTRREFGSAVICVDDAPRVRANEQAIHLDLTLPMSNYHKGTSALVDCLILAASNYLVKGRSNLSDASLVFNPDLPYSFRPDVHV